MTNDRATRAINSLPELADAHGAAARAATLVLSRRLEQVNMDRSVRLTWARHLMNLTSSLGQVAAYLARLESYDPQDVPPVEEVREEVVYLGTSVLAMLEEIERRHGPAPAEGWAERRAQFMAGQLIGWHDDERVRLTSAGEAIAAQALAAAAPAIARELHNAEAADPPREAA